MVAEVHADDQRVVFEDDGVETGGRIGLHEIGGDNLADDDHTGGQAGQTIGAQLVLRRRRVVGLGDGVRFVRVELSILVQVGVDRDACQARFLALPLAVAVQIVPFDAVDFAALLLLCGAIAEIERSERRPRDDRHRVETARSCWMTSAGILPGRPRGAARCHPA